MPRGKQGDLEDELFGYASSNELCEYFEISPTTFRSTYRPQLREVKRISGRGSKQMFLVREFRKVWLGNFLRDKHNRAPIMEMQPAISFNGSRANLTTKGLEGMSEEDKDLLLFVGAGGKAMDPDTRKYRKKQIELMDLRVKEKKGELVNRKHVEDLLGIFANGMRSCGDTLQRNYGKPAVKLVNSTLDNIKSETKKYMESVKSGSTN